MPYYYAVTEPQVAGTAQALTTTITNLMNWKTSAAGQRAYIQKIITGMYSGSAANAPVDAQVAVLLQRTSTLLTAGTTVTAEKMNADSPISGLGAATLTRTPTTGAFTTANATVQLQFNARGTAMWAAFNPDEAVGIVGSTAPNAEVCLRGYASASTTIGFTVLHSE